MRLAFFEEKSWLERLRIIFWFLISVGVVLLILILVRGQGLVLRMPEAYQAVFLSNNQVYFGKLKALNREFLSLTDIYYLRAGTVQQIGTSSETQVDLIKLGSELHGPRDEMILNKEHIIFYEDIGENSEIMKLIRQHKSGK